jgi:signal transduction histidine kinase
MFRALASKLRPVSRSGDRPSRVSIVLAFLIISLALGVLAWRSYELSVRMERGANTLAVQYAGYAADITARRVDAAVRAEITRAVEDWQQVERWIESPTRASLSEWLQKKEWIVQAIYIPDHDPASSIFASELGTSSNSGLPTRDFYTSSGAVTYTYDPARLLKQVASGVQKQQPLIRTTEADFLPIQQQADVIVVRASAVQGLVRLEDGFAFYAPLGAPMTDYSVRAVVRTSYVGSGWENQRLISFWVSLAAVGLMALGAFLALRGLNREAETMALRGALIANVSHELRTPLSMIRLGAETLKLGARLKDRERDEIHEQILRETLHLSHLVENVLDVARIQNRSSKALAFTPVAPRDLVATLVSTYESWVRSKGFTLQLEVEEGVEPQLWDRDAVSRALLNLIDNAIKYSADDRTIVVALRQTDRHIVLEVRDNGLGIAPADLSRIFDPYYRARFSDTQTRRGAGLGLTLVQQIVAAHGGTIEVESQAGAGSTFRLLFPRASGEERVALSGLVGTSKPVTS